jgi:hypothetical protein
MHNQKSSLWNSLKEKKDLTDEITKDIETAIKDFHAQYKQGKAAAK